MTGEIAWIEHPGTSSPGRRSSESAACATSSPTAAASCETEALREQFVRENAEPFAFVVEVADEDVIAAMDDLAAVVRAADAAVYPYTWGGRRLSDLVARE